MMVRTRFAPSPTGYLHIGGVRTALFNWLYAKQHGGKFILRIDDTDQERNLAATLQPILDGFRWLGILWDEGPEVGGNYGPYFQSEKSERYQHAVEQLIESGHAYYDFATSDEIKEEREAAEKTKETFVYSRKWMAKNASQKKKFEAEGRKAVVRLKMPREGECKFHDHIRGDVEVSWKTEQDHVIQRADGTCLYHLASVVDDYDMEITHVIRAEEHLSNTPRQIFIAQGLEYDLPEYVHIPFVAEPGSSRKLSKRKIDKYLKMQEFSKIQELGESIMNRLGEPTSPETFNPVLVEFYQKVGYLPHAIVNGLLMLGWAYDDKKELFSFDEMKELFNLEKINKSPASFDPEKLTSRFQEHYMKKLPIEKKASMARRYLEKAKLLDINPEIEELDRVFNIIEAAGDRIKVGGNILDFEDFFIPADQLQYDEKAFEKRIRKPEKAVELLTKFRERLASLDDFETEDVEKTMKDFVEEQGIKIGDIIHAVRVAVTGKAVGFGMFETLSILGKEECLTRIDQALSH